MLRDLQRIHSAHLLGRLSGARMPRANSAAYRNARRFENDAGADRAGSRAQSLLIIS